MCLMQTDLPVPDGPRIIEIWLSGRPRLSPLRILLRPNALCTSMNSIASTAPSGRGRWPWCHSYSFSWPAGAASRFSRPLGSHSWARYASWSLFRAFGSTRPSPSSGVSRISSVSSVRSSSISLSSAANRGAWVRSPEHLGSQHSHEVHEHRVQDHRLGRRRSDAHGSAGGVVPVVEPDEDDHGRHRHALYHAV